VNPYDPESVAGAIANALEMPLAERKERHAATLSRLRQNGGNVWSENFLNSLRLMGNGLPVEDEERAEWAGSTGIDRILATQRP
jgi:trehalose 6-phosphate synthase